MQRIPYFVAPLASTRSVLSLTGSDAPKFLQGLVTNDILNTHHASKTASSACTPSVYAGFLSAPGRVLHDTFILPQKATDKPEYLIDYPKNVTTPPLLGSIKRYILRSKVKAREVADEWRLLAVFPDPLIASRSGIFDEESSLTIEKELEEMCTKHKGKWWKDTRNPHMGYRLLLPPDSVDAIQCMSSNAASHNPS
jgi:folate-binding Fe-S cluster repair protein YgfZ